MIYPVFVVQSFFANFSIFFFRRGFIAVGCIDCIDATGPNKLEVFLDAKNDVMDNLPFDDSIVFVVTCFGCIDFDAIGTEKNDKFFICSA